MNEVYHSGEIQVQESTGERQIAMSTGRVITNTIIKGAINFIEQQPLSVVSSMDAQGQVWTSLLVGDFGFTEVPDQNSLILHENKIYSPTNDIFFENIQQNPTIGTLYIELSTRRRFRINGQVQRQNQQIFVNIGEAYPNCPKYIQRRVNGNPERFNQVEAKVTKGNVLTEMHQQWIKKADTLFVGSSSGNDAQARLDASHRGGNTGFVQLLDEQILKIPDYKGNAMFNTLGNFAKNPQAGLLFIDFAQGKTLQLTGTAELLLDQNSAEDQDITGGTGRYWTFKTKHWIETENHHKVDWKLMDYSPFNP
ncbi:hypothetical protein BKI52_39765 [marine bacterium AO1-C]|nr:hypothetical protein BKI52_39765 [marine bacterium AO1-C]